MNTTSASDKASMRRRRFLQTAIGSMAGVVLPAWRLARLRPVGPTGRTIRRRRSATKSLVAGYGRLMKHKGLSRQAGTGLVYPSSYRGTLYDWDLYFDSLALLYFGLRQPAIGGLQMFLRSQREDGFICRRIVADPALAKRGWGPLENEEHCKPFLCQLALWCAVQVVMRPGCRPTTSGGWIVTSTIG